MSTTELRLPAEPRTEFGKGAARRVRRAHRVPAVIYGHGAKPIHVSLPGHETMMALKQRNAVIEVDLSGDRRLVLVKDIQRDALRGTIEHVDLIVVDRDERVQVEIPITMHGIGMSDTVVTVEHSTITVEAPATSLPDGVDVDVTGFTPGRQVLAKDLALPSGVTLVTDPEAVVVHATIARSAVSAEAESEETTEEV